MRKLLRERSVWAPQRTLEETFTSPKVSFSILKSDMGILLI